MEDQVVISNATKSFKKISERICIGVCGSCIHLCVDCDLVVECVHAVGDRAFDDLCVCVRCRVCSESMCLGLW